MAGMQSIQAHIQTVLEYYLQELGEACPPNLYQLVINEVEIALFKTLAEYNRGNQSKTARMLGINRATLRKKMQEHAAALSPSVVTELA